MTIRSARAADRAEFEINDSWSPPGYLSRYVTTETPTNRAMLHIHLAKSLDAATRNNPVVGISLEFHAAFFNDRTAVADDCPLLYRMSDYFFDCELTGADVHVLLVEIDTVSNRIGATSPHQMWLRPLRDACEAAMAHDESIFVFCD